MADLKKRVLNLLIAFDQFAFCVVSLGSSDPDETLSAASYRWWLEDKPLKFLKPVIDRLFFFQPDHCYQAFLSELKRKQLPEEYHANRQDQ